MASCTGAGAGVVYGQNAHARMSLMESTLLGANGAISTCRQSLDLRPRFGQAPGGAGGAVPSEQPLFAAGRVVQGRVEALARAFFFAAFAPLRGLAQQARERRRIAIGRRAHGGGEFRAQHRFEVAGDEHVEQRVRGEPQRVGMPVAVDPAPAQRAPRMRLTSLARSASGSGVMCAHARPAHSWRSTRGIAANVGRFSGSGPFGGTTESSTSAETWLG